MEGEADAPPGSADAQVKGPEKSESEQPELKEAKAAPAEPEEPEEPEEPDEPDEDDGLSQDGKEAVKLEGAWQQLEGTPRTQACPKFLVWNEYGHVASYPDLLRVEIQRNGEEKSQVIKDYDSLQLAAVSEGVVCLASTSSSPTGARIQLRPTQRWEKAVFSAPLGHSNESPEAIASGEDFVAVLTSSRLLRLYTFSGLPLGLLSTPGQSVALSARGSLLLVVTRVPGGEEDELEFRLLDTKSRSERSAGHLPLSEGALLRWVGFTDEMVPVAIDTMGVVRALLGAGAGNWGSHHLGAEWTQLLSLDTEECELWAVNATSSGLVVVEVETEPCPPHAKVIAGEVHTADAEFGFGGLKPTRTIPWFMPLGAFPSGGEAIEFTFREQLLLRHQQALHTSNLQDSSRVETVEKKYRTSVLKLFTHFAKSGEVERAHHVAQFYLAKVNGGDKVLEMACKLAESAKQYKLADEISSLCNKRESLGVPAPSAPSAPSAPPLFRPGEFEGKQTDAKTPTLSTAEPPSAPSAPSVDAAARAETKSATSAASAASPAKTGEKPQKEAEVAAPRVQSTNPFLRKRPNQAANGARQPATPMASGSPVSKIRRT